MSSAVERLLLEAWPQDPPRWGLETSARVRELFARRPPEQVACLLLAAAARGTGARRGRVLLAQGDEEGWRLLAQAGEGSEEGGPGWELRDLPVQGFGSVVARLLLETPPLDGSAEAFLGWILAQAGPALEGALMQQELEAGRQALRRHMRKLNLLTEVGRALNVIDDRNRLLTEILGRAAAVAEAEKGSIMLVDPATDELVVHVVKGIDPATEERILKGEIQCRRLRRGEGIAGQVVMSGIAMIVHEVGQGSAFVQHQASRVSSILCVPMHLHGEVIGALNITNKLEGKTFTEDDLEIIQQVADQAAVAIHNARLYELAVTDSLTRLFIRRHLFHRLHEEVRRAGRHGHPLSLLMIDVDHFKSINDRYGHPFGDTVLMELAQVLRQCTRETDLVGRYGGEEFCMVLPETDLPGAVIVAERLQRMLSQISFVAGSERVEITVSVGVAGFPRHGDTVEALVSAADQALYGSKSGGRDRITVHSRASQPGPEEPGLPVDLTVEPGPNAPGSRPLGIPGGRL